MGFVIDWKGNTNILDLSIMEYLTHVRFSRSKLFGLDMTLNQSFFLILEQVVI
jgi:hypothetical protein